MLEKSLKYYAFISIYILLIQFFQITGYYTGFGIDIILYVDYSELILNALPKTVYAFMILSLLFVVIIQDKDFHIEELSFIEQLKKMQIKFCMS